MLGVKYGLDQDGKPARRKKHSPKCVEPALPGLRPLRQERGIPQKALEMDLGVCSGVLAKWELGRSSPSIKMLKRLCTLLDVNPSVLMYWGEGMDDADAPF